jgi:glycosyltransferase involved in cell wall biosynthesis
MSEYPLVSIIIPVYNAGKFLAETINSALDQTWVNKEVIIVDDGSTDNSLNIAKKFKDPRIRIFEQKNSGASAARNKGLSVAEGEYIQFLDADDLLSTNKIEEQVKLLKEKPYVISTCATIHFFDSENPFGTQPVHEWYREGSTDSVQFLTRLYGGHLIGPAFGGMITSHSWLCSKAVIDRAGRWNEELTVNDDGEYFCRVILASDEIIYAPNSVCYYRKYKNKKSLSATDDYRANQSRLMSTDLKAQYLLGKTDDIHVKLVLCRLYYENAVSFFPKHKALAMEAEKKANILIPEFRFNPFYHGITFGLSKLIGWKSVRYLQYLKNSILQ